MNLVEAVVLAGGRASRMGGTDKLSLELGGRSLLQGVVDAAVGTGCTAVTVVGPERPLQDRGARLSFVHEDPPFSGPVAGIAAAADDLQAEWVLLLAADLVDPLPGVERLVGLLAEPGPEPAHVLLDADGQMQWLLSAVRRTALVGALAAFEPVGASVRQLFEVVGPVRKVPSAAGLDDVDTWEDWERHRKHRSDPGVVSDLGHE